MSAGENILIAIVVFFLGFSIGFSIGSNAHSNRNMFCPECGRHYRDVVYCEYDGTELKEIQK